MGFYKWKFKLLEMACGATNPMHLNWLCFCMSGRKADIMQWSINHCVCSDFFHSTQSQICQCRERLPQHSLSEHNVCPHASKVPNINSIYLNDAYYPKLNWFTLSFSYPLFIRCLMWHLCPSVRAQGWSQMRVVSLSPCIRVTHRPQPRITPPPAPRHLLSSTYLKMTYRLVKHAPTCTFIPRSHFYFCLVPKM